MINYGKMVALSNELLTLADRYSTKPTKADSKRLRNTMSAMKNLITPAKKELIAADKGNK